MIISAINGINQTTPIRRTDKSSKDNLNNTIQEKELERPLSNYGKAQIGINKSNPSFGFDAFTLGLIGYFLIYAGLIGASVYQTNLDEKTRKKEEERLAQETAASIDNISTKLHVPYQEAREYHYDFLKVAEIKPTNDGNEIGLNAVQGYGIEKYRMAMDVIAPIVAKNKDVTLEYTRQIPNGVVLYGPTGGGKTYMAEKVCEHLAHFDVPIEDVDLDENNHAKNVRNIQNAFAKAEENYKKTGKITVINFKQDVDVFFLDRRNNPECIKEVRALLKNSENCAKRGAVWIGTANNPKMMDAALLRPGRTDVKVGVGDMEDFAVADMIKYTLYKCDEKQSSKDFDYPKVLDTMKKEAMVFTPAELEMIVTQAKANKPKSSVPVTADMVIAEMIRYTQDDFPTLTDEIKQRFSDDKEYIASIDEKSQENSSEKN